MAFKWKRVNCAAVGVGESRIPLILLLYDLLERCQSSSKLSHYLISLWGTIIIIFFVSSYIQTPTFCWRGKWKDEAFQLYYCKWLFTIPCQKMKVVNLSYDSMNNEWFLSFRATVSTCFSHPVMQSAKVCLVSGEDCQYDYHCCRHSCNVRYCSRALLLFCTFVGHVQRLIVNGTLLSGAKNSLLWSPCRQTYIFCTDDWVTRRKRGQEFVWLFSIFTTSLSPETQVSRGIPFSYLHGREKRNGYEGPPLPKICQTRLHEVALGEFANSLP